MNLRESYKISKCGNGDLELRRRNKHFAPVLIERESLIKEEAQGLALWVKAGCCTAASGMYFRLKGHNVQQFEAEQIGSENGEDIKAASRIQQRNVGERLLLFVVAVPSLIAVILIPNFHQLPFNALLTVFMGLAGREMARILNRLGFPVSEWASLLIGFLLPAVRYLEIQFPVVARYNGLFSLVVIVALLALALPIFMNGTSMKQRLFTGLGYMIVLLYPSFLGTYAVALTGYPSGPKLVLLYIVCVQANDSFAWVFGMLFGKKNRGLIDVSPNKSLHGFLGGLLAGIAVFVIFALAWPKVFQLTWYLPIFALAVGCSVILGDLAESLMKRAAEVKDSGILIRGRGGVLDSIDSLLFVAPLYYYILPFIMMNQG